MTIRLDYPFRVRPLTDEEGGGYLIAFPDLPGCLSDGETIEEAIREWCRRAAVMDRDRA
jgi:antitoxin HicB